MCLMLLLLFQALHKTSICLKLRILGLVCVCHGVAAAAAADHRPDTDLVLLTGRDGLCAYDMDSAYYPALYRTAHTQLQQRNSYRSCVLGPSATSYPVFDLCPQEARESVGWQTAY
jgi:hypothetical protein